MLLAVLIVVGLLCGCRGRDTQSDAPEGAEGTSSQNTQNMETVPCHHDALLALIPQAVQDKMKVDAIAQFKLKGDPEVRFEVYGVFGDVYVLFVEFGGELDVICSETVDGIEIWYGSHMTMRVYYNGHYYKLQEAFDAQIIDHFKLESAVENYYYFHPLLDPDGE